MYQTGYQSQGTRLQYSQFGVLLGGALLSHEQLVLFCCEPVPVGHLAEKTETNISLTHQQGFGGGPSVFLHPGTG